MKARHRSPHAETVLAFLRSIGALITTVRRTKLIVIEWRFGGHHGVTKLSKGGTAGAAYRAIAEIRQSLGLVGAAA